LYFDLTSYAKSKSPACAGLGFFSDLSIAAVSMVSMAGSGDSDTGTAFDGRGVDKVEAGGRVGEAGKRRTRQDQPPVFF
jgi:hypothetical protein